LHQLLKQNKSLIDNIGLGGWCYLLPFLLLFCFSISVSAKSVTPIKNSATFTEYLIHEKTHLANAINEAKQQTKPKSETEYSATMKRVSTIVTMTRIKIDSLEGFLNQQSQEQFNLNQRLKHLQQMPLANDAASIEAQVAKVETLLSENSQTAGLINDNIDLAKQFQTVLNDEMKQLQFWHSNFVLEQKLIQIRSRQEQLNRDLSELYQKNILNQNEKHSNSSGKVEYDYESKLLINNQHIAAIHHYLNALNLQKKVIKTDLIYLKSPDTKNLQLVIDAYKDAVTQYAKIEKEMQQIVVFLNEKAGQIIGPGLKKSIHSLQSKLKKQLEEANLQKAVLLKNLTEYQNQLKQIISARQTLAEYNINSWPIILNKISAIPGLFYKYIKTLSLKVYDSYQWLNTLSIAMLWGGFSLISLLFFILNRFLKTWRMDKERSRLAGHLYDGVLVLLQRNLPYLCLVTMLWGLFYITHISFANYQLLFNLIAVWFTFKILILIARLVLLERISDSSGKDVKLYYRIKWLLLFGGWTTALMTVGHLLPLSLLLQDIFNRLFMLFLLTVSLVAWKSKDVIPYLLRPLIKGKKRYVKNALSLLVILIPITLFSTAIIGLSGFINLAWAMSLYQAYALLVLVGYILSRGLLFDALELLSEWMISSLRNGWLWIEVFLKPADKIFRIVLLLFSFVILFQLFGWHSDSFVMVSLEQVARYTIINITGIHITVASTIEFFILLALFVWASKWTREFCYRWLYLNTKDAGVRNSLAVFSQYAVILVGSFITLHVLGIDFSGMSMILGGLAVGMGFGLRDFASNIIGGIILLIERPVREGDLVTIGEYEGRVAHIGIRSMRVSSWDNMEVLIPNAETFNKPFTNWTHQDSIVRTVVPIKVSRADDPVMIQQLIFDVLAVIPEIVPDPPAQVFLKKIDEALIEFEVRYFINVEVHTRFEVRSKLLFAITAQFKAANVKPPVEPITVEFKEGHSDFHNKKLGTEN